MRGGVSGKKLGNSICIPSPRESTGRLRIGRAGTKERSPQEPSLIRVKHQQFQDLLTVGVSTPPPPSVLRLLPGLRPRPAGNFQQRRKTFSSGHTQERQRPSFFSRDCLRRPDEGRAPRQTRTPKMTGRKLPESDSQTSLHFGTLRPGEETEDGRARVGGKATEEIPAVTQLVSA